MIQEHFYQSLHKILFGYEPSNIIVKDATFLVDKVLLNIVNPFFIDKTNKAANFEHIIEDVEFALRISSKSSDPFCRTVCPFPHSKDGSNCKEVCSYGRGRKNNLSWYLLSVFVPNFSSGHFVPNTLLL